MRKVLGGAALSGLLVVAAAPAQAQTHCAESSPVGVYACASMSVSFAAGVITLKVQNVDLWAAANGLNPDGHAYAITGIGIEAPSILDADLMGVTVEGSVGTLGSPAPRWSFTKNLNGFTVEAGASSNGINGGILGCNGSFGESYFRTCTGGTANTGWVVFTFQTGNTTWDSNAALLAMRAQGGAWSYRCSDDPTANNGAPCTPPTTTVPEPFSMVLMATGMLGLGIARRRRRSGEVRDA